MTLVKSELPRSKAHATRISLSDVRMYHLCTTAGPVEEEYMDEADDSVRNLQIILDTEPQNGSFCVSRATKEKVFDVWSWLTGCLCDNFPWPIHISGAFREAQTADQVWEERIVDFRQCWDNRVDKKILISPNFIHKVTGKAPWVNGRSTSPWPKSVIQCKVQSHVGYHTGNSEGSAQPNRLLKEEVGRRYTLPTRKSRRGGNVSMHIRNAKTTSEAILVLKNRLQQGIPVDSFMYCEVLRRCLKEKDLVAAKQVHECITKSGLEQNIFVANNLLNVYVRCGRLQDGRRVFDELQKKDTVSWNTMIGGYAQHNSAKDALEVLKQMHQERVQPNDATYFSILKACSNSSALKWGVELHAYIRDSGFESNVHVGTALLYMYVKCGRIQDARKTFDKLVNRNIRAWNMIIGAYTESGFGVEAYQLFLQMIREAFKPDPVTYLSILNANASAGASEWVKKVHKHAHEAGLDSNVRVSNALVHMYAKSGNISDARLLFDRMADRDVITWNAMIGAYAERGCGEEAYKLFIQMIKEGFKPNAITYVSILNAAASAGALEWVKNVHRHACEAGLTSDVRVGSALVHMYAKSGSVVDARLVFDAITNRNVITWNAMIGAYAEGGCGAEAYKLFTHMIDEDFKPDAITYVSILNASASAGALEWVRNVHRHACEAGLESKKLVGNALVHMYAKSGSIDDARLVFNRMTNRDVITYNAMIGACADGGHGAEAYNLFTQMVNEGFKPDVITYVSILNASASEGALEWVRNVHKHAREAGFESNKLVGNALVHMYAKSGSIDDARLVFDRMTNRDVVSWNVMIGGLAQHGCGHEALEFFRFMIADGVEPDEISFVAVLSACSHAGLVDEGRRLYSVMLQEYGIKPAVLHCNCMVDLLGRAGNLEEAKLFIDKMPVEPNVSTWGALLGACRSYSNVELGQLAAKKRAKLDPENASTYVLLSNIYAAAGMWQEVTMVRTMMQERGIRKQPGCSWIEVDNEVHAFYKGDTSHPEAEEIYAELSRLTEQIKAEGYIPETRLVLHDIHENERELVLCSHSERLAIAYGLISTPQSSPLYVYKNLRVCSDCHTATKFISKVTRKEIVVRDANRFHRFKDGVCSCKDYW